MLLTFGIVMGVILCVGILCALFVWAVDDGGIIAPTATVLWLGILITAFIVVVGGSDDDQHPKSLCLHGHQVWELRTNPPMMVGKVFMPGSSYREKQWLCDEWESN